MTTAGGIRIAQTLIIFRSAGISMFIGAAFFLLVKVTLHVWMWFSKGVLSVFANVESHLQRPIPP